MRNVRLRRIVVGSVFKYNFYAGLILGLLVSLVLVLMGYTLQDLGLVLGIPHGILELLATILGVLLAALGYGLLIALGGSMLAIIYNIFASAAGGIVVRLDDSE